MDLYAQGPAAFQTIGEAARAAVESMEKWSTPDWPRPMTPLSTAERDRRKRARQTVKRSRRRNRG